MYLFPNFLQLGSESSQGRYPHAAGGALYFGDFLAQQADNQGIYDYAKLFQPMSQTIIAELKPLWLWNWPTLITLGRDF